MIKKSLIILISLSIIQSTLVIYSPQAAKDMLKQSIDYTIANFGHIPYGKTMIGKIVIPNPTKLCQPDLSLVAKNKVEGQAESFLLADRGDCKFTVKALNAQKSGGELAIITDRNHSSVRTVMADDGFGFQVDIPSIFISYESGQTLRNIMKNINGDLIILIKFDTQVADKALLNLWIDPSDRHSYILIRDFHSYYLKIKEFVQIDLYYKMDNDCLYCQKSACLVERKYCFNPHDNDTVTGVEYIRQALREYFVFQQNSDKWWKYMDQYDKECSPLPGRVECAEKLLRSLGFNVDDINKKIAEQEIKIVRGDQTNILKFWSDNAYRGNILFYPDVSINNLNYQGQLIASDVFEMLCNSLTNPPDACSSVVNVIVHPSQGGSLVPIILLIVFLTVILFVVAICVYRRVIRKQMQREMSTQVNQMVSQYIAFYDNKENSTHN